MKDIYTVSAVNQYIKHLIASDRELNAVYVRGEVSNCKYHTSGHIYFTLKDKTGAMACVMFAGDRKSLDFRLIDGLQVVAFGRIDVYERDGRYQLYVKSLEEDGRGALYERFERLKARLLAEGLFDTDYKKTIPFYPRTVGIVTAPTGAAIKDIMNIAARRNPYIQLVLYPAQVQGVKAAASIVRGIQTLAAYGVDVIIVGRGGGSIEELWAFNEEVVARAIFTCETPVISAVGHETDTTIADFVADMRAPTPSAAAELAVPEYRILTATIANLENRMDRLIAGKVTTYRQYAEHMKLRLAWLSPENRIRDQRMHLMELEERLESRMTLKLHQKRHQAALYFERLKGLSPLNRLQSGYAFVTDAEGQLINSIQGVSGGQRLHIAVADGDIEAVVKAIKERRRMTDGKDEDAGDGI